MKFYFTYRPVFNKRHFTAFLQKTTTTSLFIICFGYAGSYAQTAVTFKTVGFGNTVFEENKGGNNYDEVPVTLNVPRIGSIEMQCVIYNEQLYLPVKDLFDFLKIRNTISPNFDLVEGFLIQPKDAYFIDKENNRIVYQHKAYELNAYDLIRTASNLYLKSDYFGEIFGLDCFFDFRNLSATLNTTIELPAIREMQQELMRQNINRLKGEKNADTTIGRSLPLFHIGMVDWAFFSSRETEGETNTRLNLGIGGLVAGGEMNLSLNYHNDQALKLRQQFYQWRYVNNENKTFRQVTVGKIFPQSTSLLFAPVVGMQFTNARTAYRRSFGTFTLSNTTEPGWIVELYINNVLVNYTKADASGFFTFEVPMVYGSSLMKLRFYGPWGEERMTEKYITVPFNFVPQRQLEYTVSAGIVEDNSKAQFTRANLNYGLSRRITLGGGMEYLSSVRPGKSMPYINVSALLGPHLLISAEHAYGVRSKTAVNYRLPSNLQFDFTYIRYVKGQTAINFSQVEEKKLAISMPLRGKKFNAFSRLTINQFTFPFGKTPPLKTTMKYTSAEYLLSSVIAGVNSNFTSFAMFNGQDDPLVYSNLSLTFRLPAGIRVTPQAQYQYRQKNFSTLKIEVEKNIFKRGFLNLSYERNYTTTRSSLILTAFRYNFSFAQTFFSAGKRGKSVSTVQSARGSLMIDTKTNYIAAGSQMQTGKGGIIVLPYLDINGNGRRDAGEPRTQGLKLLVNGGNIEHKNRDTLIRISGLEAYTHYYLELDKNSFDNIAWQLKKTIIKVVIEPNFFKTVEVPVTIVGEVSGKVVFRNNDNLEGLGRIIVNIYNSKSILVSKTLTEQDGYFSFMGLAPGNYTASVDATQLGALKMQSSPAVSFRIRQSTDGDMADGLSFIISNKENDTQKD